MDADKQSILELRAGIYQIRAERPGCHVYLIKGRSKNVLIDTGLARSFPYLEASLGLLGLIPSDIHLILLTHEHFDYVNALERLSCLHVAAFYPGHGRISTQPADDMQKALQSARDLLAESKALFEALDTKSIFGRLFMAARRYPGTKSG